MQVIELATTISMQSGIVLPPNYKALYGRDAHMILLLDDDPPQLQSAPNRAQRQARLQQALAAVAQAGIFAHIEDASAWQRDQRTERPQPGRQDYPG